MAIATKHLIDNKSALTQIISMRQIQEPEMIKSQSS